MDFRPQKQISQFVDTSTNPEISTLLLPIVKVSTQKPPEQHWWLSLLIQTDNRLNFDTKSGAKKAVNPYGLWLYAVGNTGFEPATSWPPVQRTTPQHVRFSIKTQGFQKPCLP